MTRAGSRYWLLTGLNLLTAATLVSFALEKLSAGGGPVDDGLLLLLLLASFLLAPPVLVVVIWQSRRASASEPTGRRLYRRLSYGFVFAGWLAIALPALFWGAVMLRAWEPWPLSLRQGPDTESAREGFTQLFGAPEAGSVSDVYFYSFTLRDVSYNLRFRFADPVAIEQIVRARDLVEAPAWARRDTRFDLRAWNGHLSWWPPEEINAAGRIFVDRRTGEKIAGTLPRESAMSFSRVLWVDEARGLAFYREIEF